LRVGRKYSQSVCMPAAIKELTRPKEWWWKPTLLLWWWGCCYCCGV